MAGMQPHAPFAGVLLLPDRTPFGSESPVTLADGRPVAMIRWHKWTMGSRFDVVDPVGGGLLASGAKSGFWGTKYELRGATGQLILELKFGIAGASGRGTVRLPDGRTLRTKGNWSARQFSVTDDAGNPVGGLTNTSGIFSVRADSLAFELTQPVLSVVEAIGLAQCVRAAAAADNAAAAG